MGITRLDAAILVGLSVVEVIAAELVIRAGIAGVERASSILFILIILNAALLAGLHRRNPAA